MLAPIAVDAVTRVIDPAIADNVNIKDIRVVKKVGGTIDDTELVDGLVLNQNVVKSAGGPTRMEKAKIGLIQFQLSPPKPDVSVGWIRVHGSLYSLLHFRWITKSWSMITVKWIASSKKNVNTS